MSHSIVSYKFILLELTISYLLHLLVDVTDDNEEAALKRMLILILTAYKSCNFH